MNKVIGQATVTIKILGPRHYELTFIAVQRDGHKSLIGKKPEYRHDFWKSKMRAGIHGQDTQRVVFDRGQGYELVQRGVTYKVLIEWIPEDFGTAPKVLGICLMTEYERVEAERAKADLAHQKTQALVPSFWQQKKKDQDEEKRRKKKGMKNLLKKEREPAALQQTPVDTTSLFCVKIYGHEITGTLPQIVNIFTEKFGEDPTEDLVSNNAVWKKKQSWSYVIMESPPSLPPVNIHLLNKVRIQRHAA